jgi:hypothetical protein
MRLANLSAVVVMATALVAGASLAHGQAAAGNAGQRGNANKSEFRRLAPGVETTIPVFRDTEETVSRHDIVDLLSGVSDLAWTPNYSSETHTLADMAKNVPFRRTIWNLEFTFKPLRMIEVDVPQASGKMERKVIWYMVYRVKNNGGHLRPVPRAAEETASVEVPEFPGIAGPIQSALPQGTWSVQLTDKLALAIDPSETEREAVKFMPLFTLESTELKTPKAYLDHLIPVAIPAIKARERISTDKNFVLRNSVQMAQTLIPLSTDRIDRSVWGVVTWEDVDPSTDYFSIYVQGLTNAYRWEDPAAVQAGSPPATGRTFTQRTLKLNFWRPGDEFEENEREIRYGVPGEVDYEWVWRP